MKKLLIIIACLAIAGCSTNMKNNPYVIEVVTFKYKSSVESSAFWARDAKIETEYTSKQSGFISRESGYSENDSEVLVVVRWKTEVDAEASMKKFMNDETVVDFVEMIDASTMKMKRYNIK